MQQNWATGEQNVKWSQQDNLMKEALSAKTIFCKHVEIVV
jgi:hypothetical protein